MPFKMPRFFRCEDSEVSRVRLTVQSRCFNRRKVVFRFHTKNTKDLNEIIDKIKALLGQYGNDSGGECLA
jgi:hypothetical protein